MWVQEQITKINQRHNLSITEDDIYVFDSNIYLSSLKAAELLNATYHAFCNYYSDKIVKSMLVSRLLLGKNKWYLLSDLERLLRDAAQQNKTIFDLFC